MQQQVPELKLLNVYLIELGSHRAIVSFNWTISVACVWFYFGFTHRVWKKKTCFIETKHWKFTWTPVNRNSTKWSRCFDVNISFLFACLFTCEIKWTEFKLHTMRCRSQHTAVHMYTHIENVNWYVNLNLFVRAAPFCSA